MNIKQPLVHFYYRDIIVFGGWTISMALVYIGILRFNLSFLQMDYLTILSVLIGLIVLCITLDWRNPRARILLLTWFILNTIAGLYTGAVLRSETLLPYLAYVNIIWTITYIIGYYVTATIDKFPKYTWWVATYSNLVILIVLIFLPTYIQGYDTLLSALGGILPVAYQLAINSVIKVQKHYKKATS